MKPTGNGKTQKASNLWYLLLLLPYVGLLWVSSYAKSAPTLWGFPFFYWYQFLWIPVSAIVTGCVYWKMR